MDLILIRLNMSQKIAIRLNDYVTDIGMVGTKKLILRTYFRMVNNPIIDMKHALFTGIYLA